VTNDGDRCILAVEELAGLSSAFAF